MEYHPYSNGIFALGHLFYKIVRSQRNPIRVNLKMLVKKMKNFTKEFICFTCAHEQLGFGVAAILPKRSLHLFVC